MTSLNRRWFELAFWLWLGCSAIYFLTAPGRIDMIDGAIRFDVTRSLMEIGRPVIRHPWLRGVIGRDGYKYSFYPLGTSLVSMPLVAVGGWLGHGSLESRQFAFSLTTIPFAAGVVALSFLIWGRLGIRRSTALAWAMVLAFCTPLWPYAGSSFDTAIQAFFLTLAVWAVIEAMSSDRQGTAWAVVAGAAFAALVNVQETYAVLAACIFADVSLTDGSLRKRLADRRVQIMAAGVAAGLALVLAFNQYKFGNPLQTGRSAVPHPLLGWPTAGLMGLFFSPAKSILLYSPTYVFALLGLRRFARSDAHRFAPLTACLAIHILLTASLSFWAGEWAWGPRYLIVSLPLVCLGFAFVEGTWLRRTLAVAAGAGLLVQLLALSVDHQRYYVERSLTAFFWMDESWMYKDSPLFARPRELRSILRHENLEHVRALVPCPCSDEMSMTSSLFGPPIPRRNDYLTWMHEYLVFLVPRPWTFWSRYLSVDRRPGNTELMMRIGLTVAAAAFGLLGLRMRDEAPEFVSSRAAGQTSD